MKKKILPILLMPLAITSLNACGAVKYELYVSKDDMRFQKQIIGQAFDSTGLVVKEMSKDGKHEREIKYTIDAPEIVEGDSWSITINAEGYDPVTLTGETRNKIKVACVGDSLTAGHVWQSEAYPVYLGNYLGSKFEIGNFGENGTSITGYGGNSIKYITRSVYTQSIQFNPDVIVFCLGTNDGTDWEHAAATFERDYHTLVDSYLSNFPNSQWVFMVSPPCKTPNTYGIQNEVMREQINPVQRAIAEEYGFPMIDLREEFEAMEGGYDSMLRPTWNGQVDMVHYSKEGAQYVANRAYETMNDFKYN